MTLDICAIFIRWWCDRIAIALALPLTLIITLMDALDDIEILHVAHDNIIAAWINGIA